ncbi:GntR family transcriptional regulator [Paraburkholderia caballeronis]|uniref:aminotransferase-like domain-containing protein n=1 Tax=Paraburkholderia caballeronis TaxID=416943 RepID=UPI00106614D8|nr:PLP-dependent aminotransferase family protein [Paraburkholderia caballeronis]TDV36199.1 GntR family transcriptional regulator [Paraburkholderia caballeronis]
MTPKSPIHSGSGRPAWVGVFVADGGPRYLQIVAFIERAIADGALRPGDRLPPQRQLAAQLGVDLTTVTRSFTEARRRQLIDARGPLGTFVAAPKVELAQRVDLSMNIPPPPAGVDLEALLREGVTQVLIRSDIDLLMTYHLGGGSDADRDAGARWLKPMLGRTDAARVIVSPGAQAALAALILAATQPGDVVLTGPLVYPGFPLAARQLGRRVETVEVDADGMRPDALEAACGAHGAKLVYLNPTLQNPTAHTMPEARRLDIVKTAARCNATIVEDDPYWLFAPDAPPPLARLAPQRVCYLSTLSKCLSPGLRTAFVVLPESFDEAAFAAALRSFSLMSAPLTAALATQWIHDGSAAQLLAGVRDEAAARQRLAAQTLAGSAHATDGIHVWHTLPGYWAAENLAAAARAEGLVVAPSTAFHSGERAPNAIRISLGGCSDRAQLRAALNRLSTLLAQRPADRHRVVI